MSAKQSQIEINGRIYDAKTGELVSVKHSKSTVVKKRQVIDGFVKPKHANKVMHASAVPKKPHQVAAKAKNIHSTTKKTQRLHPSLSGIRKPSSSIKRHKKTSMQLQLREEVAVTTEKTEAIQKHSRPIRRRVVKPAPIENDRIAAPLPFIPKRFFKQEKTVNRPVMRVEEPTVDVDASWFRRHLVPAAASFSVLILLGGFLIYNSLPALTMRVAASRAGFNASVPSYQPSGFTFNGPVSYGPGKVVIKFNSNTDERDYIITEKKSAWDSVSLLENYVISEAENYLTFEEHGLTVYLYDKSRATWVDEGVWYNIEGSANLSSEQLLKIAASL